MESWIKLYSKFIKWEWSKDPKMVSLFINLLLRANYKESKWRGMTINRGQIVTGRNQLSVWTGISHQSIRTCIKRLKSTSEITIKPTNQFSVITICNYEEYQNQPTKDSTSKLTINQPATNHILEDIEDIDNKKDNIGGELAPPTFSNFIIYFNKQLSREFRGCGKSRKQFAARVKQGRTAHDFAKSIENMKNDNYHHDTDYKYATPELLTRESQFEKFLNMKN